MKKEIKQYVQQAFLEFDDNHQQLEREMELYINIIEFHINDFR